MPDPAPSANTARNAAAVLLTRGEGAAREVLLVERAPELRFFGGYWALPGGVRDAADGPDVAGDDRPALRRCAVRELAEETGIRLGDATPAVRDVCRILTPPFAPTRYDTLFVQAPLPDGQTPAIAPGELVRGAFFTPRAALGAWRRGELRLVPPAVILLELLAAHADLDAFGAAAAAVADGYRRGKLHRVQFSPGVMLLPLRTPTLPPATTTNCYVVGTDVLWIVDPGTYELDEQARLFEMVDELVAEGARVEGILATHHHRDHVGAIAATCQRYRVAVRGHALTLGRLPPGVRLGAPLADGARIDLGAAPDGRPGWFLEAIHTPGHDRGHLCFRESRYDTMLVGDMLSSISTIVIDPPEGHLATYLDSLERLGRERLTTLYPAHGPAVRDGQRVVAQYRRHRAQREEKLFAALTATAATEADLLPQVYADVDTRMLPVAARSLAAGLEKLAEDGRARRDASGRWHRLD